MIFFGHAHHFEGKFFKPYWWGFMVWFLSGFLNRVIFEQVLDIFEKQA